MQGDYFDLIQRTKEDTLATLRESKTATLIIVPGGEVETTEQMINICEKVTEDM